MANRWGNSGNSEGEKTVILGGDFRGENFMGLNEIL